MTPNRTTHSRSTRRKPSGGAPESSLLEGGAGGGPSGPSVDAEVGTTSNDGDETWVNIQESLTAGPQLSEAEARERVVDVQSKLFSWSQADPGKKFNDLNNWIHHPANLAIAASKVLRRRSSNTVGVDGESGSSFLSRGEDGALGGLRAQLRAGEYQPPPNRGRLLSSVSSSKKRTLGIPTVRQRIVEMAVKQILEPIFEPHFSACNVGYRPGLGSHDAVRLVMRWMEVAPRPAHFIKLDVSNCFGSLHHQMVLGAVRERVTDKKVIGLLKKCLRSGTMFDGKLAIPQRGIAQGSVLSPLLLNILLSRFDARFPEAAPGHLYIRYADDLLQGHWGDSAHANDLLAETASCLLNDFGLHLSPKKTEVRSVTEGVEFLGYNFKQRRRRNKVWLEVRPTQSKVDEIRRKVCRTFTLKRPPVEIVAELNPILQGWSSYFSYSKADLISLDNFVDRFLAAVAEPRGEEAYKEARAMLYDAASTQPPSRTSRRLPRWMRPRHTTEPPQPEDPLRELVKEVCDQAEWRLSAPSRTRSRALSPNERSTAIRQEPIPSLGRALSAPDHELTDYFSCFAGWVTYFNCTRAEFVAKELEVHRDLDDLALNVARKAHERGIKYPRAKLRDEIWLSPVGRSLNLELQRIRQAVCLLQARVASLEVSMECVSRQVTIRSRLRGQELPR